MKKKKKRMLSIAGMCCCGFLAVATAISGSSAYQTDHDEVVNIIRTGNNTIIPDEDFPTPTPVPSSGSVVKKVRAKNTGDVPCYVRAYITCSEPVKEFTGLDTTNWEMMAIITTKKLFRLEEQQLICLQGLLLQMNMSRITWK